MVENVRHPSHASPCKGLGERVNAPPKCSASYERPLVLSIEDNCRQQLKAKRMARNQIRSERTPTHPPTKQPDVTCHTLLRLSLPYATSNIFEEITFSSSGSGHTAELKGGREKQRERESEEKIQTVKGRARTRTRTRIKVLDATRKIAFSMH